MTKRTLVKLSVVLGICMFILLQFAFIKSVVIMSIYSKYNEQKSVMERKNFEVNIPGGWSTLEKDWYPFVMTFHDEGISSSIGEEIDLSILYNFGAFEKGRSMFYQEDSDYFSSFYGGYVIDTKDKNHIYGFQGDQVDVEEIEKITKHDLGTLVLESMGCNHSEVSFQNLDLPHKVSYLSRQDWIQMDSEIYSKSPMHQVTGDYMAYIQYGKPPKNYSDESFSPIKLAGRIYCRYFPEYEVTIILYIIAPNFTMVEKIDDTILSKTVIK